MPVRLLPVRCLVCIADVCPAYKLLSSGCSRLNTHRADRSDRDRLSAKKPKEKPVIMLKLHANSLTSAVGRGRRRGIIRDRTSQRCRRIDKRVDRVGDYLAKIY